MVCTGLLPLAFDKPTQHFELQNTQWGNFQTARLKWTHYPLYLAYGLALICYPQYTYPHPRTPEMLRSLKQRSLQLASNEMQDASLSRLLLRAFCLQNQDEPRELSSRSVTLRVTLGTWLQAPPCNLSKTVIPNIPRFHNSLNFS